MIMVLCILILIKYAVCANILFISALPSPSHYLWNKGLALELVQNGHNVTIITHDTEKEVFNNYTVITIEGVYDQIKNELYTSKFLTETSIFVSNNKFLSFITILCQHDINSNGFKTLLNYPDDFRFDLILFDISYPLCLYGFITKFNNPPVIAVLPFTLSPQTHYAFGSPLFTSYMPYFFTKYTNTMNLHDRIFNLIYLCIDFITYRVLSISTQDKLTKIAFGDKTPSIIEIERNISLLLLNIDPIMDYPIPLAPNVIPVGGLHVRPPKALPLNLEIMMSKSHHGVIYFSLGSNLHSSVFTNLQIDTILKVFIKFKQLVLWKYNLDNAINLPKNVVIQNWFPQNDVLGHPKTKLFITHCGALGTQEAIYHGVPMVGIPFLFDQKSNAAKIVSKQIATIVDYNNFTFNSLHNSIKEVLENPRYKENVKLLSIRYKSQPQTMLQKAMFWIEHVLQYGNVEYLNTPSRDMPLYKLLNIDVIAIIILFIATTMYAIKILVLNFKSVVTKKLVKEKTG